MPDANNKFEIVKQQASTSFFTKKAAKKLLFAGGVGTEIATTPNKQKFFASFFQKRSSSFSSQTKRDHLLAAIAAMLPALQAEAVSADADAAFPQPSFDRLIATGLLTATLPVAQGGLGFGEGAEGAQALLHLFMLLGQGSLAVARLYEAHVNALQLVLRYGAPKLAARVAADAANGHLFALWVTDPHGAALAAKPAGDGYVLEGAKAFCSGAGIATRALITAGTEAGTRMLIVALEPDSRVLPSEIKLSGMRAAITGSMAFTGMAVAPEDFLGAPGDYLREPVFSAGAWRGSAAALGGLVALAELHRGEILKRGRDQDPHQRARFGQLMIAHETARLWMQGAARRACLEDGKPEAIVAYVNLARLAVETACLDAMRLTQRSLGLGAFIAGHPAERLCRDLATYLRQPAPDETLDVAARYYFTQTVQVLK
jgi:alkylation response protein AidB-like acyl-CoA dehydrogenase